MSSPIHPGRVDWTGENPGIYLKELQDGPWTGLATFFRVVYSPYGMGSGVLVLDQPGIARGLPEVHNFCISDNEALARFLVEKFFSRFASFRVSPGIGAISYVAATEIQRAGDTRSRYQEIVKSDGFEVVMTWGGLGEPYAVDMPAEKGPTKEHQMYSLFLDASEAEVTINGKPLKGRIALRDFADTRKSTAFLAFSESWMQVTPRECTGMIEFFQYLASGLVVGCIYGLIAIGYTAVYNVTGIVNFAQGDASMLGALGAVGLLGFGAPLAVAIGASVLLVGLLGVVMERVAIRPAGSDVMRGIIITIGVGVAFQGIAVIVWGTDAHPLPAFSGEQPVSLGGVTVPPQALWILGSAALLMVALYVFYTRTYLGKAFRACAMDPRAAGLMGIPTGTMRGIGFLLSGLTGAIAGVIVAPVALMQYDSGVFLGIKGFVACIIGGFGNPLGAALGGLVLGLLEAFSTGYLSSGFKNAIAFVVLLVFLFLRPGGLLGELGTVKR